ncbi:hypothetical protein SAMN05660649_00821 [Desulfotomaculum arcticum]|uniref:Uncharacterized protein n=1 Tax=Desulfotruncus arcticus DSM 17038 TaxID=1121424 RepID=A0A1I2PBN1_9FIRM|nr:hypothetical protein SAMN05660649_00821 [Desulfotomaculum arcticum] [Desulfotruncus arcticus DSM 17038]
MILGIQFAAFFLLLPYVKQYLKKMPKTILSNGARNKILLYYIRQNFSFLRKGNNGGTFNGNHSFSYHPGWLSAAYRA